MTANEPASVPNPAIIYDVMLSSIGIAFALTLIFSGYMFWRTTELNTHGVRENAIVDNLHYSSGGKSGSDEFARIRFTDAHGNEITRWIPFTGSDNPSDSRYQYVMQNHTIPIVFDPAFPAFPAILTTNFNDTISQNDPIAKAEIPLLVVGGPLCLLAAIMWWGKMSARRKTHL